MVTTMKNRNPDLARTGVLLAFFALGLAWSAHSRADDESKTVIAAVVAAAPAHEQVVRLPALKVGGIRSGQVLMISDSGTEIVQLTVLAQRQMSKPSPFPDFCAH
jgi:hypothetical protein